MARLQHPKPTPAPWQEARMGGHRMNRKSRPLALPLGLIEIVLKLKPRRVTMINTTKSQRVGLVAVMCPLPLKIGL
jgi:hypothetical protein